MDAALTEFDTTAASALEEADLKVSQLDQELDTTEIILTEAFLQA